MNASTRRLAVLALVGLASLFVGAAPALAGSPDSSAVSLAHESESAQLLPLASINSIWNQIMGFVYNTFRSRERMIQLTLIGVTVGLFIMLRRMPGKV